MANIDTIIGYAYEGEFVCANHAAALMARDIAEAEAMGLTLDPDDDYAPIFSGDVENADSYCSDCHARICYSCGDVLDAACYIGPRCKCENCGTVTAYIDGVGYVAADEDETYCTVSHTWSQDKRYQLTFMVRAGVYVPIDHAEFATWRHSDAPVRLIVLSELMGRDHTLLYQSVDESDAYYYVSEYLDKVNSGLEPEDIDWTVLGNIRGSDLSYDNGQIVAKNGKHTFA